MVTDQTRTHYFHSVFPLPSSVCIPPSRHARGCARMHAPTSNTATVEVQTRLTLARHLSFQRVQRNLRSSVICFFDGCRYCAHAFSCSLSHRRVSMSKCNHMIQENTGGDLVTLRTHTAPQHDTTLDHQCCVNVSLLLGVVCLSVFTILFLSLWPFFSIRMYTHSAECLGGETTNTSVDCSIVLAHTCISASSPR